MPLESPKLPDPILEEFGTLTGMTSTYIRHVPYIPNPSSIDEINPPRSRGRPRKSHNRPKPIQTKIQSPSSASVGAGSVLKRLRNLKVNGKGRNRNVSVDDDLLEGKHSISIPLDDVLTKVVDRICADKVISSQIVFNEGFVDVSTQSSNAVKVAMPVVNRISTYSECLLVDYDGSFIKKPLVPIVTDVNNQGNYMKNKEGHVVDESVRKANKDGNGTDKEGTGFVFGNNKENDGILKRPTSLLLKKMKKGVEDSELQMNFVPQCVSKLSDGIRRIDITVKDIKKGVEACCLQLYGYFVSTSMDYMIVNANLSRMWRVYDVADITKTNSRIFYFKFKSEEGMKAVLESGLWMVNNVPLVLNV
ncbi:ABC transporter B family member 15-like protein [Tanacetum coccineum]|uniref:ABC transporter B family member 15-like protein n=1 Tax=Tanacetum coccineum TaxID=301880 RepID=A0ABQ4WIP2_9ASTR